MLITIVAFIFVLAVVILAHELGHFITAKRNGVMVREFGIGYPPRLFALRHGETEYSINLLPLGGFVKMAGEEDPQIPGSLAGKRIGVRFLVLSAGSIMNFLLPIIIFTATFTLPQNTVIGVVQVYKVAPDSPAERAGLQRGDIILKINGQPIRNNRELAYNIHLRLGSEIEMLVRRGATEKLVVHVIPRWSPPEGEGPTGILVVTQDAHVGKESYPIWKAIPMAVRRSYETLILARNEVIGWFVKSEAPQLAGPIGIAQMTGEVAKIGISPLLEFTALLSMNLAVLNLLPIPMLDGGRLLFVTLEAVRRGKRIPPEREALVHLIGFVAIITLVVIISYFDIVRIMQGESLLK